MTMTVFVTGERMPSRKRIDFFRSLVEIIALFGAGFIGLVLGAWCAKETEKNGDK